MFRVITVRFLKEGAGRKRIVSKGPLHPDEQRAHRWAEYLRSVGDYYDVRVEGNRSVASQGFESRD